MSSHTSPALLTMKVGHFEQNTDLAVLLYQLLKLRHKVLLVFVAKPAAHSHFEDASISFSVS